MTQCRQLDVAHELSADDGVERREEDHGEDEEDGDDTQDVDALPRPADGDTTHLEGDKGQMNISTTPLVGINQIEELLCLQ